MYESVPWPPQGYVYLLDGQGNYLTDDHGNFLIVAGGPLKPPNNHIETTDMIVNMGEGHRVLPVNTDLHPNGPAYDRAGRKIRWDD